MAQRVLCSRCGLRAARIKMMDMLPSDPKILKSALGATESVEWQYFEDTLSCLQSLNENGFTLAAVEQTLSSKPLQSLQDLQYGKIALVFGHEMNGVDQKVIDNCSYSIEIPQAGTKHSLNIAVCAGIVLWEFFRSLMAKGSGLEK